MKKSVVVRRSIQLAFGVLLLVLFTMSPLLGGGTPDSAASSLDDDSLVDVLLDSQRDFGEFHQNLGQINNPSIRFYAKLDGGYLGVGTDRITLWSDCSPPVDVLVFGESKCIEPHGIERTDQVTSYFLGSRGTFTNIRSYGAILYEEIIPGLDMVLDESPEGIFCEMSTDQGHDLTEISEMFKVSDEIEWIREEVASGLDSKIRFNLKDQSGGGFHLAQDDEVRLSRCIGGSDRDEAHAIAVDANGSLYVTGRTRSLDFPTVNAYDDSLNAGYDLFVSKIRSDRTIEYSTYIGGSWTSLESAEADDVGSDITVDAVGNAYITGYTKSDDFPTVNPMFSLPDDNETLRGDYNDREGDVFILKLDSVGMIAYSTYFGGRNGDIATSISLDAVGNIYFAGRTSSIDFPLVNEFDDINDDGNYDGFISCISAAGDQILFSTFFGGIQNEYLHDFVIDNSGNLIVTGNTRGSLSLTRPLDNSYGGNIDAFVLKIDSGWNVVYSTYLGGSERDQGFSVSVDASGVAYITGETLSPDFPIQSSLYDEYQGSGDCFITAISEDGSNIEFSSYLGGAGADERSQLPCHLPWFW